ncbi:AcrR family transcriptional regulator [Mycobacteroides abscessus]|nr:AcrR family transcriptional regulator [Mycobacteroides abscessus]
MKNSARASIVRMSEVVATGRRANRRGLATRESMLEAALRVLASGDPAAVSANKIAKECGATWGAVKYQFGDIDGLWAAVLQRTAERRGEQPWRNDPVGPLDQRVSAIVETLYRGLTAPDSRAIENLRRALPPNPPNSSACTPERLPSWPRGSIVGRGRASRRSTAWRWILSECARWRPSSPAPCAGLFPKNSWVPIRISRRPVAG